MFLSLDTVLLCQLLGNPNFKHTTPVVRIEVLGDDFPLVVPSRRTSSKNRLSVGFLGWREFSSHIKKNIIGMVKSQQKTTKKVIFFTDRKPLQTNKLHMVKKPLKTGVLGCNII